MSFLSFQDFIRYAYEQAPAVRERFARAGLKPEDVSSPADLPKLPLLRKTELGERQQAELPFGGFLATPVSGLRRIFVSPGPIYDPQGREEDYWRWGEALAAAGFGPGDIVQVTFSYHLTPAGFMFDEALQKLGCVVVPAGVGNTELQVKVMRDLGVTGYVGVPSFLYSLLKKAEEMNLVGELKLRRAWVTAEYLAPELRELLQSKYGIEVFQGYGTADVGCVAYECPVKQGMHLAQGVVVEIVDPETGQPVGEGEAGEVVLTLMDATYPLLRLATGDLSAFINEPCPCGRPGKRLAGVLGRTAAGVKVRGLFLYPHQVKALAQEFPEIKALRAVVTQRDFKDELTLEAELVEGVEPTEELAERLAARAKEVLRLRSQVVFVPPGTVGEELVCDRRSR
ncbi:putative phenylacetate-coenzyme A ligase [Ammonifex degensii KC4]|uniref:Phenylacetate-coenzyme A ligase n=1 Tax=Ammonifex degensii (strain DSM 10501 / KC4) TaxID=429009 RepID=C9R8Q8_AMMDK|nr:AMP-binding protein [Ammonifex degensii]ACX52687.1 putative phenylacetate-coenzyme A ligase [Ammonifex degensii KC4]